MEAAVTATPPSLHLKPAADLAPVVSVSGIVKRWGGLERPVLDGVDLRMTAGQAIHISGRNGVGKTTLLRILAGLIMPDEGELSVEGAHPERNRIAYQRKVAFLPAGDRGLYARLSVRRHLEFWARMELIPRAERRGQVERALERFYLAEIAERRADRLSQGQRQRLRLAGLMLHDPSLVMLDEPLNSLDDEASAQGIALFREVVEGGGALIWCSPSGEATAFDFAETLSLKDGRLEPQ